MIHLILIPWPRIESNNLVLGKTHTHTHTIVAPEQTPKGEVPQATSPAHQCPFVPALSSTRKNIPTGWPTQIGTLTKIVH